MNTSYIKYNDDNPNIINNQDNKYTIEKKVNKEENIQKLQNEIKELKRNKEYIDFQTKQSKFSNYVSLISYLTLSLLLHFFAPKLDIITVIICSLPILVFAEIINIATNDIYL